MSSPDSGISDNAAESATNFMRNTTRRLSDSQSPRSPGLTDDLAEKSHRFMDSTATHATSHSKHIPDVTSPGVTDEVVDPLNEFVKNAEDAA